MKVIKYVQLLLLTGILFQGVLSAQEKSIQAIKDEYARKNTSWFVSQSPDLKWYILKTLKNKELSTELYSTEKNVKIPLPDVFKYYFMEGNFLLFHKDDILFFKDLKKGTERKVKGNFAMQVLENSVILYDRISKDLMIYNSAGDKLFSIDKIELFKISKDQKNIVMEKEGYLINLNTDTLKKREIKTEKKYQALGSTEREIWGLGKNGDNFYISRWLNDNTVTTQEIILPQYLKLYSNTFSEAELRQGRFLLVPVTPKTIENENEIPEVYYSKLSYQYKDLKKQLAVYDLNNNTWKWLPKENDRYSQQQLVSDTDFISYDLVTKNYDTLYTTKTSIQLIRNFGDKGINLHNPYIDFSNFYYAKSLEKLLFFEKGKWRVENLKTGEVSELEVPVGTNFLHNISSGLHDNPLEPAIPIKGDQVILTEKYDLFLLNLKNLRIIRLTKGSERKQQYRIALEKTFNSSSSLDISREIQDPFSEGILVRMFDTNTFLSGLECITETGKVKWKLKEDSYIRNVKRYKNKVLYTATFYNTSEVIKIVNNGKLILTIAPTQEEKKENLRYKLFKYKTSAGSLLDAVLLYPRNYQKGKKYPMIVNVYENTATLILNNQMPSLSDGFGFNHMHYVYQDYFVLLPQIDFKVGQLAQSIPSSIENVVHEVLKIPEINKDKIGVTGGSFGGYESALLIGKTNIFATSVIGVPIIDLPRSFLTYGKMIHRPEYTRQEHQQHRMGANLFDNWPLYLDSSPIYHINNVTNPVLIWIGKEDINISPDQGRSYFLGLKRQKKNTIILEYPKEGHYFTSLSETEDLNIKTWQWFEYFLKDAPPPDWMKPMLKQL